MTSGSPNDDVREQQLRQACAELNRRLRAGESCRAEDLLAAYPELAAQADLALELIYTEFAVRDQLGQNPSPDEWFARFPHWQENLQRLLYLHRQVGAGEQQPAALLPPEGTGTALLDQSGEFALAGYDLIAEIGRGGMGVVYKAWQVRLRRLVAIKMILVGAHAAPEESARFRAEAEVVARLQHPNIVQIHEVGEHDGHPFFVLEYVDGGNLDQQLVQRPLPPVEAAQLVEILARAIHAAHRRRIVHCDLKPANILLQIHSTERNAVPCCPIHAAWFIPKITDFGLARQLEEHTGLTKTHAVLGTPSYMAPEQAAGRRQAISQRTDVYALGTVLYEALTGRPPFLAASPLETLEQVRREEPVSLMRLQPHVPRDLQTICMKCLQKEPHQRYATAEALSEDLRRFLAGEPIVARPVGRIERLGRWCRRKPLVATLTAAVTLLLLVILVGAPVAAVLFGLESERARRAEQDALENFGSPIWPRPLFAVKPGRPATALAASTCSPRQPRFVRPTNCATRSLPA